MITKKDPFNFVLVLYTLKKAALPKRRFLIIKRRILIITASVLQFLNYLLISRLTESNSKCLPGRLVSKRRGCSLENQN